MNTDELIEKRVAKVVELYSDIETDVLEILARHFRDNKEFLNSDYWRIQKLEELGVFNDEVVSYIAKRSKTSKMAVKKALNDVGLDTINYNKLTSLYNEGKIQVRPEEVLNNPTLKAIINYAYNDATGNFIDINGLVVGASNQAYIDIVEKTYLEVSMGVRSYDEAIRSALDELGNKGIQVITYATKDGKVRHYTAEGLARREILNATRGTNADLTMELLDELQPEYVYLSEHIDCRPTHFDWQGTVIKRSDLGLDPVNYGAVDGLCGINCRHYFEPYFGDPKDVKKKYSKEECAEQYKLTQKQRYYERGVRAWQRQEAIAKGLDDPKAIKHTKYKLNFWRKRLNNFCEDNGLRRDFTREYIYR